MAAISPKTKLHGLLKWLILANALLVFTILLVIQLTPIKPPGHHSYMYNVSSGSNELANPHENVNTHRTLTRVSEAPAAGCDGNRALTDCLAVVGNVTWRHQPPPLLEATCCRRDEFSARNLLLVFVLSAVNMTTQRAAIRDTWGAGGVLKHLIFLVQQRITDPSEMAANSALSDESARFGDIFLMTGPLEDTYECLTLKVLAFLRRYSINCAGRFHYLLKSDTDSYWNAESLTRLLQLRLAALDAAGPSGVNGSLVVGWNFSATKLASSSLRAAPPEILGSVLRNASVRRRAESKFCTPVQAYAPSNYPDYVSGGPGYLLSDAAVSSLMAAANRVPPFWIKDVYTTRMLVAAAASLATCIRFGNFSDIYLSPMSATFPADYGDRPPLGYHGLTEGQLRLLNARLSQPRVRRRARKLHELRLATNCSAHA